MGVYLRPSFESKNRIKPSKRRVPSCKLILYVPRDHVSSCYLLDCGDRPSCSNFSHVLSHSLVFFHLSPLSQGHCSRRPFNHSLSGLEDRRSAWFFNPTMINKRVSHGPPPPPLTRLTPRLFWEE